MALSYLSSTRADPAPAAPELMVDLDFGNGLFLANSRTGVFAISSDALHWRRFRSEFSAQSSETSFLEDEFGAMVHTSSGSEFATSTDGVRWTVRIPPRKEELGSVLKAKGRYVTIGVNGLNGVILTSTNGTAWEITLTTPLPVYGIAYGNGVFVAACGHEGGIFSSEDAVSWTQRLPNTTGAYQSVAFGNGRFVAVGFERQSYLQPGEIASSRDGIHWERRYSVTASVITRVCHGLGLFVASGLRARIVSIDGLSWEETPLESEWSALAFGDGKFVAFSKDEAVHLSTDGREWHKLESANLYHPSLAISTSASGEAGLTVDLSGRLGKQYELEESTNFLSWQLLTTGTGAISNPIAPAQERKFFRGKLISP